MSPAWPTLTASPAGGGLSPFTVSPDHTQDGSVHLPSKA